MLIEISKYKDSKDWEVALDDVMQNIVKFKIHKSGQLFSQIFTLFDHLKEKYNWINNYSIDSTNLEEIFWNINQGFLNEDI